MSVAEKGFEQGRLSAYVIVSLLLLFGVEAFGMLELRKNFELQGSVVKLGAPVPRRFQIWFAPKVSRA